MHTECHFGQKIETQFPFAGQVLLRSQRHKALNHLKGNEHKHSYHKEAC